MDLGSGDAISTRDTKSLTGYISNLQPPPQKAKVHDELLFINQHYDRARQGPSRRIIGSHVQRHIHKRKRLNSSLRLSSKSEHSQLEIKLPKSTLPDPISFHKDDSTSTSETDIGIWTASEANFQEHNSICQEPPSHQAEAPGPYDATLLPTKLPRDRHGFRYDPFNSYPIEFRESIPAAIDYFLHYYVPFHKIRPDIFTPDGGMRIVRSYFRYSLQHPLMFETIVTLSRARLALNNFPQGQVDHLTMYHYGQCLGKLRKLVDDGESDLEDATLFAILALICVEYIRNDLVAFQVHLHALRRIVSSRGGVDALGWPKLLRPSIVSLEYFWSDFCQQTDPANSTRPVLEILTPGELIDSIPSGFRLLALQKRLRSDIIVLLSRVRDMHLPTSNEDSHDDDPTTTKWHEVSSPRDDTNIPRMATDSSLLVVQYCQKLLGEVGLSKIERACCIALLMTLLAGSSDEPCWEISTQNIEKYIHELMPISLEEHDEHAANLLAWVCLSTATVVISPRENTPGSPFECEPICWSILEKVVLYFCRSRSLGGTKVIMRRFILTAACEKVLESAWNGKDRPLLS
ncbi:hypothetical protein LTR84_007775 [Exophiala bonariae]|uniref:Transcription factor domain-containing protein n=1 Tax=Exophiala bonariae TaxID=1690606 RepID=A0AAV9NL14_9EURO|nr:hypothetical protein LTR84_007775 [Exophiala bonariae]